MREAWQTHQSWDVAGNLSLVEEHFEMWAEAATHLHYADRNASAKKGDKENREAIQRRLDEVLKRVVTLNLTVSPDGAKVLRGDDVLGSAPLEAPLFFLPGTHELSVAMPGHVAQPLSVHGEAGATVDKSVELQLVPPPPPPNGHTEEEPNYIPALVVGGVGLVFVAGGIGALASAGGTATDADNALADLRARSGSDAPCAAPTAFAADCQNLVMLREDHDTTIGVGRGMIIGGSVAVATGLVLFIIEASSDGEKVAERENALGPFFGPASAGVTWTGAF